MHTRVHTHTHDLVVWPADPVSQVVTSQSTSTQWPGFPTNKNGTSIFGHWDIRCSDRKHQIWAKSVSFFLARHSALSLFSLSLHSTVCQLAKYPFIQNIHSYLYFYGQSNIRSKHANFWVLVNHSDSMMLLDLCLNSYFQERKLFFFSNSAIKKSIHHMFHPMFTPVLSCRSYQKMFVCFFLRHTQKNKK